MSFSTELINWYFNNKRDLPWRKTKDPYKIWLSEIILQQTRVQQGLSYYLSFIHEFPNVYKLASSKEDKILKLWQGLGYYSRARNLHHTAKDIVDNYNGIFPNQYEKLLELKGVGEYTASAIASFSFDLPYAVLDGNVIRLLSRAFGISTPFDTSEGKKEFKSLSKKLLSSDSPAIYNQAIMEFGSLQCKPRSPNCLECCMQDMCFAFNNKNVDQFPVRLRKSKIKKRYLHYFMINQGGYLFIKKRNNGIWKGLYEFPYIECNKRLTNKEFLNSHDFKDFFLGYEIKVHSFLAFKHKLSHQLIDVVFWNINAKSFDIEGFKRIFKTEISEYPVSRLMEKYLKATDNV